MGVTEHQAGKELLLLLLLHTQLPVHVRCL
jgi:hypothetical protein